jgi:hypothetical protein
MERRETLAKSAAGVAAFVECQRRFAPIVMIMMHRNHPLPSSEYATSNTRLSSTRCP